MDDRVMNDRVMVDYESFNDVVADLAVLLFKPHDIFPQCKTERILPGIEFISDGKWIEKDGE